MMTKHNSETEQDKLRKQTFFKLLGAHNGYMADRASADSEIKDVYKRAQTMGLTKKHFDLAKKIQDPEKKAEFIEDLKIAIEVAEWCGSELSTQLSLELVDRRTQDEIGHAEGFQVGAMGGKNKNPHDQASERGQGWQRGFNDGNAFRNQSFKDAIEAGEKMKDDVPKDGAPKDEAKKKPEKSDAKAKPPVKAKPNGAQMAAQAS